MGTFWKYIGYFHLLIYTLQNNVSMRKQVKFTIWHAHNMEDVSLGFVRFGIPLIYLSLLTTFCINIIFICLHFSLIYHSLLLFYHDSIFWHLLQCSTSNVCNKLFNIVSVSCVPELFFFLFGKLMLYLYSKQKQWCAKRVYVKKAGWFLWQ